MPCYNKTNDVTDYLFQDPVMTNGNWDYVAYGTTQRISKFYYDMLTNMRGAAMEDPRFTKIVPASMSNIRLDKTVTSPTIHGCGHSPSTATEIAPDCKPGVPGPSRPPHGPLPTSR